MSAGNPASASRPSAVCTSSSNVDPGGGDGRLLKSPRARARTSRGLAYFIRSYQRGEDVVAGSRDEGEPALRGFGERPRERDLFRQMTAGAVDRLEAAQRERIADRTVVRGDADVRRHVPQASEDVGGREPVQQPPQQRRRDRRGVELPRLLRRRGEPLPPPLAVALHDLEEPVADGFQAMVPRG